VTTKEESALALLLVSHYAASQLLADTRSSQILLHLTAIDTQISQLRRALDSLYSKPSLKEE
jgi:hypothetical protein